jgi:hypothetical protein
MGTTKADIQAATADANGVAADFAAGKTGYVKGKKIVGTADAVSYSGFGNLLGMVARLLLVMVRSMQNT